MTGGFVLGEVVILHQSTMKELAPLLAAALMLCVAAVYADRRRQLFWGRSLGVKLLPLFVVLGLARGYWEERTVLAEQGMALEAESTYGVGEICGITEKENWMVLLLKNVRTEEGELRYLQVYVEKPGETAGSGGTGSQAAGRVAESAGNLLQTEYRIGDVVRVWGEFTQFQAASNPGEFDYAAYYRGQKLVWRVFALAVREVESGDLQGQKGADGTAGMQNRAIGQRLEWEPWTHLRRMPYALANGILRLRTWAAVRLKVLAGEEDGSIFAAMLLGDKTGMSEEIRDLYQKNGIAHLLAVSGLHLSLVSIAAYGLLRKAGAGYGRAAVAGGAVLTFYSILTGASPSVIRALIMTLCGFLAAYLGRTYDLLSAMGLSGLMLLWYSPYLVDQAGVQLSFAAIGGIGLAKELEEQIVAETEVTVVPGAVGNSAESGLDGVHLGAQTLRLTLCMQFVSLPIVLWHFFSYPLYGIFLNLLVVPLTGVIVGTGVGGLLASLFAIPAGSFVTGGGRAVLAWYEFCCRWFMKLPGSSFLCGRPELWQIMVYYMVMGVVVYVLFVKYDSAEERNSGVSVSKNPASGYCMVSQTGKEASFGFEISRILRGIREPVMVFLLLAALVFLRPPAPQGLEVTILDTGQGDGICIRTKHEVILVDGGSTDQKELGQYRLEPFFQSKGIRQIDLAIVTHGDWDHISGLSWLMEQAAEEKTGEKAVEKAGEGAGIASGSIRIKTLAMPEAGKGEEVYERLQKLCEQQGGETVWIARGDEVNLDADVRKVWWERLERMTDRNGQSLMRLRCLYPEAASRNGAAASGYTAFGYSTFVSGTDRNEHSLVFRLDYGAFHMLLTGDMSAKGEENLMALEAADDRGGMRFATGQMGVGESEMTDLHGANGIWVLKVAHHGSGYSSSEDFLTWLHPDYAVISCGKKNRYGHPHPDTVERLSDCGSEILQTKEYGAIIWKTDGHRVTWKGWKTVSEK